MNGDISFDAPDLSDVRGVEYKGSATVRNLLGTYRDTINKPVTKFNEEEGLGPTWSQTVNNSVTPPTLGISPADPNQTPQPGDSATLTLVTEEAYDYVNWHVKAPWETSERGTYVECDWGDGTINEATFSYTFPSGAMHTGDFLITAVICRWSDLSEYEETYTVTVDMTPNCDDCTDESSTCPNAGVH